MPIFQLGELFCGPGGLSYGAMTADIGDQNCRIVHAWATDYDRDSCQTYAHNICRGKPGSVILKDVRELDLTTDGSAVNALSDRASVSGWAVTAVDFCLRNGLLS